MIDSFISFASSSPSKLWFSIVAIVLFLISLWFIWITKEHLALKVILLVVSFIPIIGPILIFFVINIPNRAPKDLRASMNHWGSGGRFIGNGSGRFTYSDCENEAPDRPVKFNPFFWKRKK